MNRLNGCLIHKLTKKDKQDIIFLYKKLGLFNKYSVFPDRCFFSEKDYSYWEKFNKMVYKKGFSWHSFNYSPIMDKKVPNGFCFYKPLKREDDENSN